MPSLTPLGSTKNALEPSWMLALMVLAQLFLHLYYTTLSFLTK